MPSPRYEIRPLGPWIGPVTEARQSSARFRAPWLATLYQLQDETGLLGAQLIVVQVDVTEGDLRRDGMLRANAKVGFPGVRISFDSLFGPLTYSTDRYDSWQANVRAIVLGLEALRAVDRYGITKTGEQYRGWTAIANSSLAPMSRQEAARFLVADMHSAFTADQVLADADAAQRAYRIAALKHHPDRPGGNADLMVRLTAARDVLLGDNRG